MYFIAADMSFSNQSQRGTRQRGPKKGLVQKPAVLQSRNMTENLVVKLTRVVCVTTSTKVLRGPFQPLI